MGRADAGGVDEVLVRHRQAVQHAERPPRTMASSALAAPAIACSATSVTIALTFGLTRSICARCALMTSRAETCLRASRAASSTAVISQSSDGTRLAVVSARRSMARRAMD